MRKRVIIGLLVLVIGGGIAALVFRPWESPVEFHIRKYKEAERDLINKMGQKQPTMLEVWRQLRGKPESPPRELNEIDEHQRALISIGYLEERVFMFSNVEFSNVASAVHRATIEKSAQAEFYFTDSRGTSGLRVVTLKGKMPTTNEVLRQVRSTVEK